MTALCECGCGRPVQIASRSNTSKGWVKGQPLRFVRGHATRKPLHYEVDCATGCWVWLGSKDSNGYGHFMRDGVIQRAHRYFYERARGPIPKGLQLDHLCRNRACVNPNHLEPVTNAENVQRGATAKLSLTAVRVIRASAEPSTSLAKRFGVERTTVNRARSGRTWKVAA